MAQKPVHKSQHQLPAGRKRPLFKLEILKEILNSSGQPKAKKFEPKAETPNTKRRKKERDAQSGNCIKAVKPKKPKVSFNVKDSSCDASANEWDVIDDGDRNESKPPSKGKRADDGKLQKRKSLESDAKQRLRAASFRLLNERMYTTTGAQSWAFFQDEDPDAYSIYHEGYRHQIKKWPLDPLDLIIQSVRKMPLKRSQVLADLGCGEARAAQLLGHSRTVHSFDLRALNQHVVECDIAELPLPSGSVDVVIFCLSLMGTNLRDYLLSAARILKIGGLMKIAEVKSRFENAKEFVTNLKRFGFKLTNEENPNELFILMDFVKRKEPPKKSKLPELSLAPCLYKKR